MKLPFCGCSVLMHVLIFELLLRSTSTLIPSTLSDISSEFVFSDVSSDFCVLALGEETVGCNCLLQVDIAALNGLKLSV